jgi:hypothetical protein
MIPRLFGRGRNVDVLQENEVKPNPTEITWQTVTLYLWIFQYLKSMVSIAEGAPPLKFPVFTQRKQQALILASIATLKWGNSKISLSLSGLHYFQDGSSL